MEQVIRAQSLAPVSGEPLCELKGHSRLDCVEGAKGQVCTH